MVKLGPWLRELAATWRSIGDARLLCLDHGDDECRLPSSSTDDPVDQAA